ncbi:flagellar hook-associated protein 2 [Caldanaerovirga acetigignens]|uniref:Flagellar hook-associated protein 2 n=1 Tax=Caldanaerovirga acetigignens TaxID=447595 RepID=A0A1M7I7K8_9FIRM|nr:flagellar filament capping protein FliD [Caldanaerovirga acetigignens]SHM36628.1 flagellar hook-associated protein 2 [Caldanaerovirga acetigignens]
MAYSNLRIGGLASGIDIDQIISDLMKVERTRVDKLYQQKQLLEWQKEDYRNINLKLKSLYDFVFNMKLQGTYLKHKTMGTLPSGQSADTYFTASAGASAIPGEYAVIVKELAESAKLESGSPISKPIVAGTISFPREVTSNKNKFIMVVDGVEKTIEIEAKTYNNIDELKAALQTAINNAFGGDKISVNIGQNSNLVIAPTENYDKSITITLKSYPNSENDILLELGFSDGATYKQIDPSKSIAEQRMYFANDPFGGNDTLSEFKFTITANGKSKTFSFKTTDSLNYILSTISSDREINVTAYYDPITDRVIFKTRDTGASASISIVNENDGGNLFGETGAFKTSGSDTGKNAVVEINGITIEKPSNTFTISGITFELKKEMATGESATLKVERDIDGVIDTIKKFVELYNETIDYINKELSEQRYRDYLPLTEEQKKELKEDEIKKWEERARSGILRSDQLVMSIRNKMREILYTPVKGLPAEFDSLLDIGIKTGSYYEKGKLYLDEAKLREALSKDPEAVMRLFTNAGDSSTGNGIAVSLYDALKAGIKSITDKAGGGDFEVFDNSFLARRIREVDDKIKVMEEKLKEIEDRYWRQFTEMEKAIAAMNQQSLWLASQLGLYSSNS